MITGNDGGGAGAGGGVDGGNVGALGAGRRPPLSHPAIAKGAIKRNHRKRLRMPSPWGTVTTLRNGH
jgi:hypothetical protein